MQSRRSFLGAAATGAFATPWATGGALATPSAAPGDLDVTEFGAIGDGQTPCWEAFQTAIDAAESRGGGVVTIPAGVYRLERTPLIASRVHLRGAGAATILRGTRPAGDEGSALISNKGQQAEAYQGAHDWSVSHLAIDSPLSNGIVVTHARNVYLGFIYGTDIYDHFFDITSENVLCEHLYLTGRSGASCFQMDSLSGSQTTWDGSAEVEPLYDGTGTTNLILRSSVITAPAGYTGDQNHHRSAIHFHGDSGRWFLFSDLILGGSEFGFYQDAGSRYEDIRINNVISRNHGFAGWFGPGVADQAGLSIHGLTHEPTAVTDPPAQRSLYFHGRRDVLLGDLRLRHSVGAGADALIRGEASSGVLLSNSVLEGKGGIGLSLTDSSGAAGVVTGCVFRGFQTGIQADAASRIPALSESLNAFPETRVPVSVES